MGWIVSCSLPLFPLDKGIDCINTYWAAGNWFGFCTSPIYKLCKIITISQQQHALDVRVKTDCERARLVLRTEVV